ncbi:MmgE/PrpD family protein [Aliiroseovarius crassostreae]|uniref:MmgE/PrpD family protein n=1 Tax=Aliiroseovarius crassostreae TaxID=154981 RepID=UPI0021FE4AC7|nr:MmgE/PrpD family protein [Aliiroseovarius crassostreae]UWQ09110.1 MmgE/PrpD family protein [Aliiroseovarius crassostreae]UWQ12188.1 MmgE/PrpD family protein [Aliiroseovarius crassostreae]
MDPQTETHPGAQEIPTGEGAGDPARLLARFAHAPLTGAGEALEMMRLSLLDWAAVSIAGAREPVSEILRDMGLEDGGHAQASVIGSATRLPARAAALINGTTSHALDYDDTHFAHIGHPSVAVIPAALALAEAEGKTGQDMLEAALIGVEASIRVGMWLGRSHYQTGFHQTATAGAFGATLAGARLLGLTEAQTLHALGLCTTRAAGLKSQFGTMGKPYHAGMAAQTGVEAARAARAGFLSTPDGLTAQQGFGPTHAGEGNMGAFEGMGTQWQILSISHKFHACCHGTHAMIEALSPLMLRPDQVVSIELRTHPRWLSVCNIPTPATGLEVKFSYAHVAAMVISGCDTAALDSFSDARARDPELQALARKLHVIGDDAVRETEAQLVIDTVTGRRTAEHDLDTPVPLDTRRRKLRAKARALTGGAGGGQGDRLWSAIQAETGPDLVALARLLRLA